MPLQLAQFNLAHMRAPLTDPVMAGFVDQLEHINAVADGAAGFVWRLQTEGGDATSLQPYDDPLIIVNMSVWESAEALMQYVYRGEHAAPLRDRAEWFRPAPPPLLALWWIEAGHVPTVAEGKQR